MSQLRPALRRYLWAIYGITCILIACRIGTFLHQGHSPHDDPSLLPSMVLFMLLAYVGERVTLQMSGSLSQSLSTAVHIAAILLFPPPFPSLITFAAVLVSQAVHVHAPLYKRAFNVCHPSLTVGLTGIIFSFVTTPTALLHAGHVGTALPLLALLLVLYYALDVGPLLGVFVLLERQPVLSVWSTAYRPTLLPELAASATGILGALVWQYDHVALILLVLPVVALRVALQAIRRAEDRAAALRRRSDQLEEVLAAGRQLRLQCSRGDLLYSIAEAARTVVGAASVTAYLRDEEDQAMLKRMVLLPMDAAEAGPPYRPAPAAGAGLTTEDGRGTLLVPLELDGERVIGLLQLTGVPQGLGEDDYDSLFILAMQAAISLENTRLHERALVQASEDGLTGLLNHRALQVRLDEEMARARRSGVTLALLIVDLDDFGVVNNTYGHQAGDATLKAVAGVLRETVRASDVAARYGGDEYALILPETEIDEGMALAKRVCEAISALRVVEGSNVIRIGASIGVASSPMHARTREDLIHAADQAAYVAKHAGKGRVARPEQISLALDSDPGVLAKHLQHANMATVQALAAAVDAKDAYTRGHSQRVSAYAVALAQTMGLAASDVARIRLAGLLHDVGKIGVPDAILSKPGTLSDDEFAILQQHPVIGEDMLAGVPFLREVLPAVRHHHERWDGQGYPDGLAAVAIPQDAAILAVADAFDAMTTSRPYRSALPCAEAQRRIREGSGTHFDPRVVSAFERAIAEGAIALLSHRGNGPLEGSHLAQAS